MSAFSPFLILATLLPTQSPLPAIDNADWAKLQKHGVQLLAAIEQLKIGIPGETLKELRTLFSRDKTEDTERAMARAQHLLDSHCLVGIHINPESRVKVARGPAEIELKRDSDIFVLARVHNEGGVTSVLGVGGTYIREEGSAEPGAWLEAAVHTPPPLHKSLSGHRLEYVVLRLKAKESGKREATLRFDVGQGTQDLGFRAESPILFVVK